MIRRLGNALSDLIKAVVSAVGKVVSRVKETLKSING